MAVRDMIITFWLCGSREAMDCFERKKKGCASALDYPDCKQEPIVRMEYGEIEWYPVGKDVRQSCILSPSVQSI